MNLRTLGIILVGVLILTGVGTFVLGGSSDAPFEQNNSSLPDADEPNTPSQDADNRKLTEEDVTLSTLRVSQKSFRLQVSTDEQGERITENVLYTPSTSYKSVTEGNQVIYEYYYTPEYTVIHEQVGKSSNYDLRDPETSVSDHLKEEYFKSVVSNINFTADRTVTRNGVNHTVYTGTMLQSDGNKIASELGVDSIVRVRSAEIVRNDEQGYISDASFEFVVQNNDARYSVSRTYNLTIDNDIDVTAEPWVRTAIQRNAGIDAYILSDDEIRLQHKYGVTLEAGDRLQVITPSGDEYVTTLNSSFEPGDTASIVQQDGKTRVLVNPKSPPSGESFANESGQYTVIFTTDEGIVEIATRNRE